MEKQPKEKVWLEKFPFICLDGIDNKRFLNGITTSNINQNLNDIIQTCLLNPKGVLKAILEIHYIENKLLILVLEGNVKEIRNQFENIIFPVDKVKISVIKETLRIQKVDNVYSWRKNKPILLSQNDSDKFISDNSFYVLPPNDLRIWKMVQAIPSMNFEIDGINNPLELGLTDLIDFKKGCFLGQEIMARLKNVSSLKQEIRIWKSNNFCRDVNVKNQKIYLANEKEKIVGSITSYAQINEKEFIGLAMIKKNYLDLENNFLSHQFGKLKLNRSIGSIFL